MFLIPEKQAQQIRFEAHLVKLRYGVQALDRVIKGIWEGRIQDGGTFIDERNHVLTGEPVFRCGCFYGLAADRDPREDWYDGPFKRGQKLEYEMRALLTDNEQTTIENLLEEYNIKAGETLSRATCPVNQQVLRDFEAILRDVAMQKTPQEVIDLNEARKDLITNPIAL